MSHSQKSHRDGGNKSVSFAEGGLYIAHNAGNLSGFSFPLRPGSNSSDDKEKLEDAEDTEYTEDDVKFYRDEITRWTEKSDSCSPAHERMRELYGNEVKYWQAELQEAHNYLTLSGSTNDTIENEGESLQAQVKELTNSIVDYTSKLRVPMTGDTQTLTAFRERKIRRLRQELKELIVTNLTLSDSINEITKNEGDSLQTQVEEVTELITAYKSIVGSQEETGDPVLNDIAKRNIERLQHELEELTAGNSTQVTYQLPRSDEEEDDLGARLDSLRR